MLAELLNRPSSPTLTKFNDAGSEYVRGIHQRTGHAVDFDTIVEADRSPMGFSLSLAKLRTDAGMPVNARAIVRDDNGSPLGVVGTRYSVIQPADVLGVADEVCRRTGGKLSGVKVLGGGADVSLTVTLPGERVVGKDVNIPTIRITANNQGTGCVTASAVMFRTFCRNGYHAIVTAGAGKGTATNRIAIRHTASGVDRVQSAACLVSRVLPAIESFDAEYARLMGKPVSMGLLMDYYAAVMPDAEKPVDAGRDAADKWRRQQDRVDDARRTFRRNFDSEAMAGFEQNAWLAVNSVTKFAQHQQKIRGERQDREARDYANLPGGAGYELTQTAIETARTMF